MRFQSSQNAVTLIELLLIIIIIAILIGVSIPTFKKTLNNLQLDSFSQELQSFMNYLQQRSVVENKIIYLNIDEQNKEYWAQIKDAGDRLKTYFIPKDIHIEIIKKVHINGTEIIFYPDGQIDKVSIELTNPDNQKVKLTTEGTFGRVKMQSLE